MQITWKLTNDRLADLEERPDFTVFDGEFAIGRVHQIQAGTDRGLWHWALALGDDGQVGVATCGRSAEGAKAGRALLEAYRAARASRMNAA